MGRFPIESAPFVQTPSLRALGTRRLSRKLGFQPRRFGSTLTLAVFILLAAALLGRTALAEERAELMAETSFAEGVKLMRADHCVEAIAKFQESQRLAPASGTALNLAYCQARLGRVASAWLMYRQAVALAEAQNKPEHARIARTEGEKLEPEVPQLTLVVPRSEGSPPSIVLDDEPLSPDMWSVPIPVDPGKHSVAVVANGTRAWQTAVTMARREHATVEIPRTELDRAKALAPAIAPVTEPTTGGKVEPSKPAPRAARGASGAQRTWAFVLGGVGAAAVVTGAALFTSARLEYDGVGDHCTGNECDDEGFSARHSAASRARASYFVLAGGGALLGASLVLFVTNNRGSTTSVGAGVGGGGFELHVGRVF